MLALCFNQNGICSVDDTPLVEVEFQGDVIANYKERRPDRGVYFGINKEDLNFENYSSLLDTKPYADLFGDDPITVGLVTFDYKFNYSLGSLALGIEGGKGSVKDNLSGQDRRLDISKYGLNLKLTADMIFEEPFIAPYVGLTLWQLEIEEQSPEKKLSLITKIGMNYTIGLLLQLNWADKESALSSAVNWGVENTFIDLYVTKYGKTSALEDPNTETNETYGAGLRMEF